MDLYSNEQNREIFLVFYKETEGLAIMRYNGNKFLFELCDLYNDEKRMFARRRTKNLEEGLKHNLPNSHLIFEESRIDRTMPNNTKLSETLENRSSHFSQSGYNIGGGPFR